MLVSLCALYCIVRQMVLIWVMLQVASVMTVWSQMQPEYAANMWNEALNKRLGTKVVNHSVSTIVI